MSKFTKPPRVTVRVGEMEADIDVKIAPLIRLLWEAGIGTKHSYQEDLSGRVGIHFHTMDDVIEFLNAVADYDDHSESLYNRITDTWDIADEETLWQFDIMWYDFRQEFSEVEDGNMSDKQPPGGTFLAPFCLVRFQPEDLPLVIKRMERHVAWCKAIDKDVESELRANKHVDSNSAFAKVCPPALRRRLRFLIGEALAGAVRAGVDIGDATNGLYDDIYRGWLEAVAKRNHKRAPEEPNANERGEPELASQSLLGNFVWRETK